MIKAHPAVLVAGLVVVLLAIAWLTRKADEQRARAQRPGMLVVETDTVPAPRAFPAIGATDPRTDAAPRAPASRDGGARAPLDRARRDEMRARIYAAFGQAPAPARPAPSAPAPEPVDAGPIDPKYLRARIREDFIPMAQQCYGELLARRPGQRGRFTVDFTLVGDDKVGGVVDRADVDDAGTTLTDPAFVTCMRESMLSMSFAPPPKDGVVTVKYPFELAPDDEADGG